MAPDCLLPVPCPPSRPHPPLRPFPLQAAVFVGAGFLALPEVLLVGAACACVNLVLWGGVGALTWKALGLM